MVFLSFRFDAGARGGANGPIRKKSEMQENSDMKLAALFFGKADTRRIRWFVYFPSASCSGSCISGDTAAAAEGKRVAGEAGGGAGR